jgi:hypothetical protein
MRVPLPAFRLIIKHGLAAGARGQSQRPAHEFHPQLPGWLLARSRNEIPDRERRFEVYRLLNLAGIINYVRLHD